MGVASDTVTVTDQCSVATTLQSITRDDSTSCQDELIISGVQVAYTRTHECMTRTYNTYTHAHIVHTQNMHTIHVHIYTHTYTEQVRLGQVRLGNTAKAKMNFYIIMITTVPVQSKMTAHYEKCANCLSKTLLNTKRN